jgi:hypothetical protein
MANNPKLNIYTLRLNPKNDSVQTFRDLFKSKFTMNLYADDDAVFKKYYATFINGIGDKEFRKDNKNKKVLGTTDSTNTSFLQVLPQKCTYIDGVIEGGKYGIRREYADTDNKKEKTIIGENKAVLDKYYILLYTPLNSQYGFLLVQSYTEESIQDSLKDFIRTFFSCEDDFYNIIIEPFVPQEFIENYMRSTSVRMFSYTTKIGLPQTLRNNIQIKGHTFEVEIKLKPLDTELRPDSESTSQIYEEFGEKYFDTIQLKECKKRAYVVDSKQRKANYDIEQEIKKIRPTIYLEDVGIESDSETGLPDFIAIQKYCLKLLDEIKEEYNSKSEIYEL